MNKREMYREQKRDMYTEALGCVCVGLCVCMYACVRAGVGVCVCVCVCVLSRIRGRHVMSRARKRCIYRGHMSLYISLQICLYISF